MGRKLYKSLTAKEELINFFDKLGSFDCSGAFALTNNAEWVNLGGEKWFCSNEGFGGITKIVYKKPEIILENSQIVVFKIEYNSEDSIKGNRCFSQRVTMELTDDNGTIVWCVKRMTNLKPPIPCSNLF